MIRCADCSAELEELSLGFIRQELTKGEWSKLAYQLVVAHHPDWTLSESWRYAKLRAPFYPFREPSPVIQTPQEASLRWYDGAGIPRPDVPN